MDKRIEVINLNKKYFLFEKEYKVLQWLLTKKGYQKEKHVLKNLSFSVESGERVGIIGANGAGKSTLMKLIAGITYPTSGEVRVKGKVGALINLTAGFNPDYTGRRNIYYKGTLMGMSRTEIDSIIGEIEEFVELGEYFDKPIRMYSSGMSARLGFALAVSIQPEILIIDEVLAVGDKAFKSKSRAKTEELFKQGKSVIFSSHSDELIRQFCNRVIYLKDGEIVYDGSVEEGLRLYNEDIKNRR